MKFDTLSAFLLMDGHGTYVWAAYGITILVVLINLIWPSRVRAGFVRGEKRAHSRQNMKAEEETS